MTRPLLGCNLYAEDRTKPTVPWKPIQGQKEDKQVEEQKAAEKDKEEKNKKPEEAQEQSQTSTEFNLLANLICQPTEKDNFKLNLFPEQFAFNEKKESKETKDDDNMISIDLGNKQKDAKLTKLIDEFQDINLEKQKQNDGQDLLDMMDDL